MHAKENLLVFLARAVIPGFFHTTWGWIKDLGSPCGTWRNLRIASCLHNIQIYSIQYTVVYTICIYNYTFCIIQLVHNWYTSEYPLILHMVIYVLLNLY